MTGTQLISLEALELALQDKKASSRKLTERQQRLVNAVCDFQQLKADEDHRIAQERHDWQSKPENKGRKQPPRRRRKLQLIASAAGYPDTASGWQMVWNDLQKSHILLAILTRIRSKATVGAVLATDTIIDLATDARSEKVRLEAASKLLELANGQQDRATSSNGLVVNINLGPDAPVGTQETKVVDVTPEGGGDI